MKIQQTENDLDLFGRVIDGKIVEYPVYRLHIRNRSHPLSLYTPVVKSPMPDQEPFTTIEESVELGSDGLVHVLYKKRPLTLQEVLRMFRAENPSDPHSPPVAKPISEVDEALVDHAFEMLSDYLEDKLDAFAQTRKWKNFDRLVGFLNSTDVSFSNEARHANLLRDLSWKNLITYTEQVKSGAAPLPLTVAEVDSVLPELAWLD